jgi:hypothetical protein
MRGDDNSEVKAVRLVPSKRDAANTTTRGKARAPAAKGEVSLVTKSGSSRKSLSWVLDSGLTDINNRDWTDTAGIADLPDVERLIAKHSEESVCNRRNTARRLIRLLVVRGMEVIITVVAAAAIALLVATQ